MSEPLITAIIPTHNRGHTLIHAVKSVLKQTYPNLELIIVDDFSKKPAAESLAEANISDPRIHVVRQDHNQGQAAARNRGAEEAKGQYLAFLDDDDLWVPQKLAHQYSYTKQRGYKASVTDFTLPGDHHLYNMRNSQQPLEWLILTGRFLALPSTLMIDKEVFRSLDGFDVDPKMRRVEDLDFTLRLHQKGYAIPVVPEFLTHYSGFHPAKPAFEIDALHAVREKHSHVYVPGSRNSGLFHAAMDWKRTHFEITGKSKVEKVRQLASLARKHPTHFFGLAASVLPRPIYYIMPPHDRPKTGVPFGKNSAFSVIPL